MTGSEVLLIFDIDGTLTDSFGLTRVAFELAINEMYSVSDSTRGIKPFGKTDQQIFREILINNNLPTNDFHKQFERLSELTAIYLEEKLRESEKPHLHKGIRSLLERISSENSLYLALGTGNIRRNAYIKLERHGVAHLFPIGGFGSDSENRDLIIETAFRRARDHYQIKFNKNNTWIIGDTPVDIECGRNLGAATIGVATGTYSIEELKKYNPTAVFSDLSDQDKFFKLIRPNYIAA